jgi:hypothetical protein
LSSCKLPVFLIRLYYNFVSKEFRKIHKYQILRKYVHWEPSCSMRTDGQTDMTKLTVNFHNFANAPEPVRYFCEGKTNCCSF